MLLKRQVRLAHTGPQPRRLGEGNHKPYLESAAQHRVRGTSRQRTSLAACRRAETASKTVLVVRRAYRHACVRTTK